MDFKLDSPFRPSGDQPKAIDFLTRNILNGVGRQTLLGVTGSGKTFTIANVIANTNLPTLVISHNKTLAGQLYQEFKSLFPKNKVSYFVSYYDYYQPEAYIPQSDTYISKEVEINDLIDKLRLETTSNLFSGRDNIVIASVSCLYNIGDPVEFSGNAIDFKINQTWPRRKLFQQLVSLMYSRNEVEFKRSTFRVRGEQIDFWPSYQDWIISLQFKEETLVSITQRHPFSGHEFKLESFRLYPAKQYMGASGKELPQIFSKIRQDCSRQVEMFRSQNRLLEAQRLSQRVEYDLEMIQEMGFVNGIENYSIYFESNRSSGDPPFTLIDYFNHVYGQKFLTIIDESHVTVPQIQGMHAGDLSRKTTLIDFGFRLPSALDNRPLTYAEFYQRIPNCIYVSATPSAYELEDSRQVFVEQIIRPTGLVDPPITVKTSKNQIPDLIGLIKEQKLQNQRTLVVTVTKKMAEDLAAYLSDPSNTDGISLQVPYLHADIETLERTNILDKLRSGHFDVLVGINLLREGLDLPEVGLVAVLEADQQGFLRSKTSLIQIMGRASRNQNGQVVLYANTNSLAMNQAILEVNRRRQIQLEYNRLHHIQPVTITKAIRPKIIELPPDLKKISLKASQINPADLTPVQRQKLAADLKKEMRLAAADLNFELAIELRDKIKTLN